MSNCLKFFLTEFTVTVFVIHMFCDTSDRLSVNTVNYRHFNTWGSSGRTQHQLPTWIISRMLLVYTVSSFTAVAFSSNRLSTLEFFNLPPLVDYFILAPKWRVLIEAWNVIWKHTEFCTNYDTILSVLVCGIYVLCLEKFHRVKVTIQKEFLSANFDTELYHSFADTWTRSPIICSFFLEISRTSSFFFSNITLRFLTSSYIACYKFFPSFCILHLTNFYFHIYTVRLHEVRNKTRGTNTKINQESRIRQLIIARKRWRSLRLEK